MNCPLCEAQSAQIFYTAPSKTYFQCDQCALVWLDPAHRLDRDAERREYLLHENRPNDLGYRRFLSRAVEPLLERIKPNSTGLDFGCGPGPTLSVMLEEHGHIVSLYDPFFFPDTTPLEQRYDFITATEVVEHLHQPGEVLQQLCDKLRPGAWLIIMTKRVRDAEAFATWHYKNDPTHVCFFHDDTFEWFAQHLNLNLHVVGPDVVALEKPRHRGGD